MHNSKMMERCPLLKEYVMFVSDVRKNMKLGMDRKDAIDRAVNQSIASGGQLAEIMRGHKAEVTKMLLEEYDEAFHIASEKELSLEEGRELGREEERQNTLREKRRADDAERRLKVVSLKLKNKTEEEIAGIINISVDVVNQILNES